MAEENVEGAQAPLVDLVGGPAVVERVVDRFYDLVVADPILARHYVGVDVERLRAHQAGLVLSLFGGTAVPTVDLRRAHAHVGVTAQGLRRMEVHLETALAELGAPGRVRLQAVAMLHALGDEMLEHAGGAGSQLAVSAPQVNAAN